MPEISRFYGIVVTMFYSDHEPPHFHVRYSGHKAIVTIDDLVVLRGTLPSRALALVREWARLHTGELEENWRRARKNEVLHPIDPLE